MAEKGGGGAVDVRYEGVWRYVVEGIIAASVSLDGPWEGRAQVGDRAGLAQRGRDQRKQKAM